MSAMKVLSGLFIMLNISILPQQYCLNYSGSDDYVKVNTNFGLGNSDVVIECWVYLPTTSEKGTFVNIGGTSDGYGIGVGSGSFDNSGNELIAIYDWVRWIPTGVNIGTGWHHITFIINQSFNANIYLDGKRVYTETGGSFATWPSDVTYIGTSSDSPLSRPLTNGKIDEVRIWSNVRTEAEIKKNMYKELTGSESNLSAYYKMSDGSGTTLTSNKTSGGTNGTITGATWQISGAFTGPKQALDFDGYFDFVSISSSLSFSNSTALTIEGWIYPKSFNPPSPDANISNIAGYPDAQALVRIGDAMIENNQLQFIIRGDQRLNSNVRLNANNWYHFAAVYDGTIMYIYINGKLDNTLAFTGSFSPTGNFALGGYGGSDRCYDGLIDELRVWSDARTATEIRVNMMKALNGNEAGLLAYYRFDQKDGTTLYDLSSNGYNGTLTNMDAATDWVGSTAFNTWIGSESSDWITAGNWSRGSIPDITDNVGVYSNTGGNELLINPSSFTAVNNMLISRTGTQTLSYDISIAGNLILESDFNISNYDVSFGSTGYLLENAGRITGGDGIITFSKNFGAGTLASENIAGLGLIISTGDAIGYLTLYRGFAQSSGGLTNGLPRYYNLNIQYGQPINLIFNYLDSEITGIESSLSFFRTYDNLEGGPYYWTRDEEAILNTASNSISLNGFAIPDGQTYRFTAADFDSPLPVELSSFTARMEGSTVLLKWKTETEVNNYGFEIERCSSKPSNLMEDFEKIGFVNGNGNSNSPKFYSFADNINTAGKYSYRLKQIDNTSQFEYSKAIEIVLEAPSQFELSQNYPNPFNPSTTIRFSLHKQSQIKISIYNMLGELVETIAEGNYEPGYYNAEFNASNLTSGTYIYRIWSSDPATGTGQTFVESKKMILIK